MPGNRRSFFSIMPCVPGTAHRGVWQLYGHSHGTLSDDEMALSFDVGVDCHNFYPISYEEVKEIMKQKKWTPPFGPRDWRHKRIDVGEE
jgi:hypothetical protein